MRGSTWQIEQIESPEVFDDECIKALYWLILESMDGNSQDCLTETE